jgi:hypothetical protein
LDAFMNLAAFTHIRAAAWTWSTRAFFVVAEVAEDLVGNLSFAVRVETPEIMASFGAHGGATFFTRRSPWL